MSNVRSILGRVGGYGASGQAMGPIGGTSLGPTHLTGVVFAGRNGLDFLELRLGVVRIPEVSLRIREAQRILDSLDVERVDLMGSVVIDDDAFFRNIKVKAMLSAVVQVGLYDRLLRTQRAPEVLVGSSNGDSALLVCAGQISFEDMIRNSEALHTFRPRELPPQAENNGALPTGLSAGLSTGLESTLAQGAIVAPLNLPTSQSIPLPNLALPNLAGMSLTEYRAFARTEDGGLAELGQSTMDLRRLIGEVVEHQTICRFINIGPAPMMSPLEFEQIGEEAGADEVTVIDSIDLDPMLNWFWKQVRPASGFAQ